MAGKIDARLKELGITLPEGATPTANYVPYTITGNLVFIAGQVSRFNAEVIKGKLGAGVDIPTGQKAARYCGLSILAHLKNACGGDLDRVRRCVKVSGFVNGAPDFIDPPQVMNGCSDLFVDVFGDAGRHARFAIAVASLPQGASVEADAVFEIA